MKEKKARVEDALHATRAAVEEGIVPGGGVAYLRASGALDKVKVEGGEKFGVDIIRRALEEPIRLIVQNGGWGGSIVVNKGSEGQGAFGFNAAPGEDEDLLKAGRVDPPRERAKIALVARTREDVESRARECEAAGAERALPIAADATDPAQLDAAIEQAAAQLGGLDGLVTLVGGSQPGGTAELSESDWAIAFERNLWPAVRASRNALPQLEAGARRRWLSRDPREGCAIPP